MDWLTLWIHQLEPYALKIPVLVGIVGAGWLVLRGIMRMAGFALRRARVDATTAGLVTSLVYLLGWILIAAAVFGVLGLTQLALAFSGSIALIAFGMASAAKHIVSDLFSGLFLIADEGFRVGSRIRLRQIEGRIIGLDIRKTRIRDDRGRVHVVPNRLIDNEGYSLISRTTRS